jgi:hypothetical protein
MLFVKTLQSNQHYGLYSAIYEGYLLLPQLPDPAVMGSPRAHTSGILRLLVLAIVSQIW